MKPTAPTTIPNHPATLLAPVGLRALAFTLDSAGPFRIVGTIDGAVSRSEAREHDRDDAGGEVRGRLTTAARVPWSETGPAARPVRRPQCTGRESPARSP